MKRRNPSTTSLDQLSDTNNKKRSQRGGRDTDSDFFESVLSAVEKSRRTSTVLRPLTIVQEAIRMLEMEYQSRLSQTELDTTIDYLSDNTKASVFIAMSSTS